MRRVAAPHIRQAVTLLSSPRARVLVVILPPLLFLGLGGWQLSRSVADVANWQAAVRDTDALAGQLAALPPGRRVRFAGIPTDYTRDAALAVTREGLETFRGDVVVAWAREVLGAGTLLGAAASLAAGAVGLLLARGAARRGLISRERLATGFERVRRVLPALLGAQVAGLAVALLLAALFEAAALWFAQKLDSGALRLAAWGVGFAGLAVWLAVATLRELRRVALAFAPGPLVLLGRRVDRAEGPGLWRLAEGIAAREGVTPPDHIVVGLIDGPFVTSSDIDLGPEGRTLEGRTLHVPAQCLALLDRDEAVAVIAHEFAHFASDDFPFSRRFLPVYAGIGRSLDAVERGGSLTQLLQLPALALGRQMIETFAGAVQHWSRRRELAADAAAAMQDGGAMAAACALIRTRLIAAASDAALLAVIEGNAVSPDIVATVVAQFTEAPGDPAPHLEDCQPHPTDSHPPTLRRIEALGLAADETLLARAARRARPEDARFAAGLFADWPGLCRQLGGDAAGAVAAEAEASHAMLEEAAALTLAEPLAFHEDRRGIRRSWVLLVIVTGFAALLGLGVTASPDVADPGWRVAAAAEAGLIIAVAFCLRSVIRRHVGQRTPFLVIDAEGAACRGLQGTLPWSAIERITVLALSTFSTVFHVTPGTVLRKRRGSWGVRGGGVIVNRRRRSVTLFGPRPRGITPEDYFKLLQRALDAFRARQALTGG